MRQWLAGKIEELAEKSAPLLSSVKIVMLPIMTLYFSLQPVRKVRSKAKLAAIVGIHLLKVLMKVCY
jgi:hypothetical protein